MHRILIWGLFFVALTGFLLGLTSSILLKAGGFLPIAPPLGMNQPNDIVGTVHFVQFYTLGVVAGGPALFLRPGGSLGGSAGGTPGRRARPVAGRSRLAGADIGELGPQTK